MAVSSTRLRLRVSAGAGRTAVVGRHGDGWKVRVGAAPERGKANAALLRFLSERLDVPLSQLGIVSGHTGRDKVVALEGLSAAEAASRMGESA